MAAPGTTVTMVALDCGLAHLGRFSQEYSRKFGEAPSETLRRARLRYQPPAVPVPQAEPEVTERYISA